MVGSDPMIAVMDATSEEGLDHARRLFRFYAAEFAGSFAEALCLQGLEEEIAGLPGRYTPPSGCLLLAIDGDASAGCVAMRDLGGGTCEMKRLYVAPEARGRGIGRSLVEAVLNRARHAGYQRMVLDTLPEMAAAIALYRSFGFVETAPYWGCPLERTIYLEMFLNG
jgi:ribosomal protein S18 acetylase RimI-like enzyme